MKTALAVILFAVSAVAQDQSAIKAAEAACGPEQVELRIKIEKSQHPVIQRDPSKAAAYVILDQKFQFARDVTARVGIDGAWVGANRGNSYLFFSIAPGEHHLCSDWISTFLPGGRVVSVTNFTAVAGKVYYFRARTSGGSRRNSASIDLERVNSDEGKLLVASSVWSNSQLKRHQASK